VLTRRALVTGLVAASVFLLCYRGFAQEVLWPIDTMNPLNRQHPLAQGLVSWWLVVPGLGMGGTNMRDLTGRNHGTLTNMAQPATSTSGWNRSTRRGGLGVVTYDGTDDYVSVADTTALRFSATDSTFTIVGWIKLTDYVPGGGSISSLVTKWLGTGNQRSYAFGVGSTGVLKFPVSTSGAAAAMTVVGTTTLALGQWYHIGVTADISTDVFKVYIDGKEDSTTGSTTISSIFDGTAQVNLGTTKNGTDDKLNGQSDDIRIYNRVLSNTEIALLYVNSLLGSPGLLNRLPVEHVAKAAAEAVLQRPRFQVW